MAASRLRFDEIVTRMDFDAFYADIGWEPNETVHAEDKGYCLDPWNMHNNGDTTGKLAINRDKGLYNCWVCGGGRVLDLVMAIRNLTEEQALDYLSGFIDRTSTESSADFYQRVERLLGDTSEDARSTLPYFNLRVLDKWTGQYNEWFSRRGISEEVAEYFRLGYDGAHQKYHPKHGEYCAPAIILPHTWKGRLVGWQERWLGEDRPSWVGKYTNTSDFPRESTLWGYDFALGQTQQPILCESVPTALFLISNGYPAIATFGAEITPDQLKLLRAFNQGIIFAPDNDAAGTQWLKKAVGYLYRYIPVLETPTVNGSGSDIGDLSPDELPVHLRGVKWSVADSKVLHQSDSYT
jgi:DNA primase